MKKALPELGKKLLEDDNMFDVLRDQLKDASMVEVKKAEKLAEAPAPAPSEDKKDGDKPKEKKDEKAEEKKPEEAKK